jgi:hypothetical protein
LNFYYWWTRVFTVGISTSGVVFLAAGNALGALIDSLRSPDFDSPNAIILPLTLAVPFFMCKCITRAEFGWKKWRPTLRRVPANHRERATQRIDERTPWRTKFGVRFIILTCPTLLKLTLILSCFLRSSPHTGSWTLTTST